MPSRPPRPAQEAKMHAAILQVIDERRLARRPIAQLTTLDVAAMAHAVWLTLPPEARSTPGRVSAALPPDLRERAAMLAPSREAAEKAPVRPPAAPNPLSGHTETPEPLSGPQKALQGLRADAVACAVLVLVADKHTDPAIAVQLGLTKYQVKERVRRWLSATGSNGRRELGVWAERNGATGAEAGR